MEVTVERIAPCQAKVSFSVPSEEFEQEVQNLLRQAGQNLRIKGFRPGKVPPAVVERHHGAEVRREAQQRFLQKAYEKAVADEELKPLSHPRIQLPEGEQLAGAPFGLDFEIVLRPDIELGEYKGLSIESELAPVMDEHVEQALEDLTQQQARPEPVGEEGLAEDGMAVCKLKLLHEGEVVFEREGLRLGPQTALPGVDADEFKGKLLGAQDGTSFEMEMTFPPDFEKEEARDQPGTLQMEVVQAFTIVRPDREELQKMLKVDSEEALLETVRERLVEAHEQQEQQRVENALLERLIDAHSIELPDSMVEEQARSRMEEMRQELLASPEPPPPEEIEKQLADQEESARTSAERATKAFFLIEAIAQREELQVTEEEIQGELREIAQRNRADIEEVVNHYRENNLFPQLAMEVLERKVRKFLRESAEVVSPS